MPTSGPSTENADPDIPEALAAERVHLAAARAALRRMRERTLSLEATGGNVVSDAYLAAALYHRAAALADQPDTPLFFGRLDFLDDGPAGGRHYVGRRHVHDAGGDPVVVDWRAEVSRAFYRASRADPMGVRLRRRFGFEGGTLTAYEDEHLTRPAPAETSGPSRILVREIERPRAGPMRDIVATIQPEQDDIVRADLADTVCVQGAPGTGKTAVGLHRAAYLLYAHRDRLRRGGVLVIGPNTTFLDYIGQVLPALGEVDVTQLTLDELVAGIPVQVTEDPAVATLKGDARMAEVLHRAVWSGVSTPADGLLVARGSRRWRVDSGAVADLLEELRARGVRYGSARAMLAQRLAHEVLVQMEAAGESPDDRDQDAIARSRPVRALVQQAWPAVDPVRLVHRLLADPGFRAGCADGVLDEDEQAVLGWARPPRGPASARWSAADAVLIDEVSDLVSRLPSYGHVILDEAQDLSAMQLRAVGRRCSTGSATVLGDLAQGTTPWASVSWADSLAHLGKPDGRVEVLSRGYRVPRQIIDYAGRLLPALGEGLTGPESIREAPGSLSVRTVPAAALNAAAAEAGRAALAGAGSVGLVVADTRVAPTLAALRDADVEHSLLGSGAPAHRLSVVPATLVKGLEFDSVVVVEPAEVVASEPRGLRRLYVVLTRAVSTLVVLHARALPPDLL